MPCEKPIYLTPIPWEWLGTPEGRKKVQKISDRNLGKLWKSARLREGSAPKLVTLRKASPSRSRGILQKYGPSILQND
jgi:hypothetical protein